MIETILPAVLIIAAIGLIAGVILAVASKFLAVEESAIKGAIREVLPSVNCGACGFAGCDEYADKLAEGLKEINRCTPGGNAVAKKIAAIVGLPFAEVAAKTATVKCRGHLNISGYVMDYEGPKSCAVCNHFYNGRQSCSYACLGFGDCVKACQYNAIRIIDHVAIVDPEKCTGCGMCAPTCPNKLIDVHPSQNRVIVTCASHDKGAYQRNLCSRGCIACKLCVKACPHDAIVVEDNLAHVLIDKCINCGECVKVCPTKTILQIPG